jgi:hypothetical protein
LERLRDSYARIATAKSLAKTPIPTGEMRTKRHARSGVGGTSGHSP